MVEPLMKRPFNLPRSYWHWTSRSRIRRLVAIGVPALAALVVVVVILGGELTPRPAPAAEPTAPPASARQVVSEVVLNPGDSIQAAAAAHVEGTTFIIK